MGGLITEGDRGSLGDPPGCQALVVGGRRYTHSAAKFWPTLIDEVLEDFPQCETVELSAPCDGDIESRHLYPEREFQRDLERLLDADLDAEIRNTLAALDLMGPPAGVSIRLRSKGVEILSETLPLDCLDAELFNYLVAWPLEWSGIRQTFWNNALVKGEFRAEDRHRRRVYDFTFSLTNRHMSEGLFERTMSFVPAVTPIRARP